MVGSSLARSLATVAISLAHAAPTLSPARHATVCFLRHGQSQWNHANRFTGWTDIDLTEVGREEAATAGRALRASGISYDRAFTSRLRRAQETLAIALHASGQHSLPTLQHWRLNERHYGALQGRSKHDCIEEYGVAQVRVWRNSFDTPPPLVSEHSPAFPGNDPAYADVPAELLPTGECLRGTLERCLPFWREHVEPELAAGRNVLISAHGHSIRALVKHLDGISDENILSLSIPNGIPLVFSLDEQLRPIRQAAAQHGGAVHSGVFLGDDAKVAAADWMLHVAPVDGSDVALPI